MRDPKTKQISFEDRSAHAEALRKNGIKIVTTNGCFDLLHLGHLNYLREARLLGDCLWVAVNSDASVKRLKGPSRPLQDANTRALQLAALEAVDYVTVFEDDTPASFLEAVQPAIHVKGGDYRPEQLPERKEVEAAGGKIVCLPFTEGFSTTSLIEKLKS